MTKRTRFQQIKLFIKISIAVCVLAIFVVIGIFMRPTRTFENAPLNKWLLLNEQQRISTIQRVVHNPIDSDILIKCVDKIAALQKSNEMQTQYAIVFCDKAMIQSEDKNEQ